MQNTEQNLYILMYCVNVFIIRIHFIVSLCPLIGLFSHSYVSNLNFNGSFSFLHSRQFYLGLVRKKAKSKLMACCSYNFGLYFFSLCLIFLTYRNTWEGRNPWLLIGNSSFFTGLIIAVPGSLTCVVVQVLSLWPSRKKMRALCGTSTWYSP